MSASLVGSPILLGIIGVGKSVRTPSTLLVDPSMTSCDPILGVTVCSSRRDNRSSLFKG